MSLRLRLALLFGVIGFLASALVGGLAYRSTTGELIDTTDEFLLGRAGEVAETVEANGGRILQELPVRPQPRGDRPGNGRFSARDDAIIQITTRRGRVVTTSDELPRTDAVEDLLKHGDRRGVAFDDVEVDGRPHRMVSQRLPTGGVVQVARSIEEETAVGDALLRQFTLIAAVVALIAAGLGALIAQRTTAPLRRLTNVSEDVAATRDFTTEVGDIERTDEIGRLATSFASMLDALEASRVQQHRLILDAGHELRTPLTSMRANVALLQRADSLPVEDRRVILDAIGSELIELGALFDEMIELATDQHGADMVTTPVRLGDIADEVAATWRRRSNRTITVSHPDEADVTDIDVAMVQRALANLVNNAVKFSPDGSDIEIVVGEQSLAVRDRGDGVAPEERDLIFNRFYRSEATRSMPGSGLGLSIVAQIAERHGGTTWVTDAPDGGAEIGFTLAT